MENIVPRPVYNPGGYITEHVIALADGDGQGAPVGSANPLPVRVADHPVPDALAGGSTGIEIAGPYLPVAGLAIWLTLAGDWSGSVIVKRSLDAGATLLPLTIGGQSWATYSANANEPIGDESVAGASYYLDIAISAGTLAYRMQQ